MKKSSTSAIVAAATRPVTCVLPPMTSLIAVRESAPVTAKPCDRPAAMLQAPSAMNSRSTSISYLLRAAKLRAVTMPLVKLTSARPTAPETSAPKCEAGSGVQPSDGSPAGTAPSTATPRSSRPNSLHERDRNDQRQERRRQTRQEALHQPHDRERDRTDGERRPVRFPQLRHELEQPRQNSSGFDREAEHLADLPEDDADGDAVHEADEHGLAEKIGQEPEPEHAGHDAGDAGEDGQRHGERGVERLVDAGGAGRERRHDRRDHRARGRVGIDDQLTRRAEDGVDHERQDRRVEPDDRRKARQLRVRDRRRQGDGGHRQTRREIVAQPRALGSP